MQVHAVPDSERVFDSTGRRLPWGYESVDSDRNQRRIPEEKGPFGKARKRGASRSKATTPGRKEDQAKLDNLRVIDDIFSRHKDTLRDKQESLRVRNPLVPAGSIGFSSSAPNLTDLAQSTGAAQAGASANPNATSTTAQTPTEVLLYGYGTELQWAAVSYYEKVSGGVIFEDYDRHAPYSKYPSSLADLNRASMRQSLSKADIRKINAYVGGDHWIKVTFDSVDAAERATHYSPHVIQGCLVYAERYRGTGPIRDGPILALAGGGQESHTASPLSSETLQPQSSHTASSATATATESRPAPGRTPRTYSMPLMAATFPDTPTDAEFPPDHFASQATPTPASRATGVQPPAQTPTQNQSTQLRPRRKQELKIKGAKPAVLLPREQALLPTQPGWQRAVSSIPVIGWIVGSGHGIIGDEVPRKEDGSFDHKAASVYWRFWFMVDSCFGTNVCGLRGLDDD